MSYVYKNIDDSKRVNIFKRETDLGVEWDVDLFVRSSGGWVSTYSCDCGDLFQTRKSAKREALEMIGELVSINPKGTITQGW